MKTRASVANPPRVEKSILFWSEKHNNATQNKET